MTMKKYSTLPKSAEVEPHHQFIIISRIPIYVGILLLYRKYSQYILWSWLGDV